MLKKILLAIGGVIVLLVGYLVGGGRFDRGRVGGTKPDFDGLADAHDRAAGGVDGAGARIADSAEQLTDSQGRVDGLIDSNIRGAALIARGREILQRAKARDVDSGDT